MTTTVNDTVSTVNAAATAIVSADSRIQQTTTIPKKRWGSCWSLYWCFGSHKNSKRISHAILVPEPVVPGAEAVVAENFTHSSSIVVPFVAPPSSPSYFLQSDPSSGTQSRAKMPSLTSLYIHAFSPRGPANIFAIGPYAYETQLVSPPVFSTFNTEPSTAPFTPPPESVHLTRPSSPEVPFAQLLTSSLERSRRNSGTNSKFSSSHYEFQSYQWYPGSPGGGSAISNSGSSSPFPDGRSIHEFHMGETPKLLGFEHFTNYKWGSRVGSGSLTPNSVGQGSRIGSGCLTPDGVGQGSRLGSGSLTPNTLGPDCLANSEKEAKKDEIIIDQRVSFELTGEDVALHFQNKSLASHRKSPDSIIPEDTIQRDVISPDTGNCCEANIEETSIKKPGKSSGEMKEDHLHRKHRSITLGTINEFNFNNTNEDISAKPIIGSEWWANEKIAGTFFPMLQPGIS